tara:strand:+ start:548 stop:1297 length:750 start_codon:yes stop_codon:yes gene_type:complete
MTQNLIKKDLNRYSKQIILKKFGIMGQKKIMSSKVLIIGMGGLGCPLALYLSGLGIGKIGIVDNDKIELSNLNRQIIYNYNDIGKYKVDVAKKRIKNINKNIYIKSYKLRLSKNNILNIIKDFDIICDGTDNFETRLLINDFCLKKKKILISAAVSGFDGHIFKFNFKKKTPCFRCYMPELPPNDNNCETDGVTPTLTGIIGTLQANEVLNSILFNNPDNEKKMIILNSKNMNFRRVRLTKNKKCKNKC